MHYLEDLNWISITLRLLLAMVCGGAVGLEREQKRRPAGLRTYMLVCMGAALVMIVSQYMSIVYHEADISRMGAQVISGIGFLGAGTIIVTGRQQVKGLTTAAGLWSVACLGLAIGIGFYQGAIICTVLIVIVLTVFQYMEIFFKQKTKDINFYIEVKKSSDIADVLSIIKENLMRVVSLEITKDKDESNNVVVLLSVLNKGKLSHDDVLHMLSLSEGVLHIEEY